MNRVITIAYFPSCSFVELENNKFERVVIELSTFESILTGQNETVILVIPSRIILDDDMTIAAIKLLRKIRKKDIVIVYDFKHASDLSDQDKDHILDRSIWFAQQADLVKTDEDELLCFTGAKTIENAISQLRNLGISRVFASLSNSGLVYQTSLFGVLQPATNKEEGELKMNGPCHAQSVLKKLAKSENPKIVMDDASQMISLVRNTAHAVNTRKTYS